MRRPGFSHVHYDAATRTASVVRMSNVPNKKSPTGMPWGKCHGEILEQIYDEAFIYLTDMRISIIVKEGAFSHFVRDTAAIYKVHGLLDYLMWHYRRFVPEQLAATSIKKLITGKGNATKEEVEAALEPYVGKLSYAVDDESDATACVIAWLIINGYIDNLNPNNQEAKK